MYIHKTKVFSEILVIIYGKSRYLKKIVFKKKTGKFDGKHLDTLR